MARNSESEFQPDTVTFRSASEIDQRDSGTQAVLSRPSHSRACRGGGSTQLRFPFEVPLSIIDQVSGSRPNFDGSSSGAPHSGVIERLKTLSLTHRSLAIPSQRALSSRLTSCTPLHVAGLSRSLNDHTYEFALLVVLDLLPHPALQSRSTSCY